MMHWKNTEDRYGTAFITLHWMTAFIVLGLLVSGFRAANLEDSMDKVVVLRVHAVLGISALLITLLRLVWRFADRKSPALGEMPRWQTLGVYVVHISLYAIIFGMVGSGMGMLALSGAGEVLYGNSTTLLPDFTVFAPRTAHGIGACLLLALILLHAGAALYHHFVLRDALLTRMGLGAPNSKPDSVNESGRHT